MNKFHYLKASVLLNGSIIATYGDDVSRNGKFILFIVTKLSRSIAEQISYSFGYLANRKMGKQAGKATFNGSFDSYICFTHSSSSGAKNLFIF